MTAYTQNPFRSSEVVEATEEGKGRNYDSEVYSNQYRRLEREELRKADPWTDSQGQVHEAHPNKHHIPKGAQLDALNNWQLAFSGTNYHGRSVDVYWKNGIAVITPQGNKSQVITAHREHHSRWSNKDRWRPREDSPGEYEEFHRWRRNEQR